MLTHIPKSFKGNVFSTLNVSLAGIFTGLGTFWDKEILVSNHLLIQASKKKNKQ